MKKVVICVLIVASLVSLAFLTGCSREKAMEQLMADPQMSQLIMDKIWNTPETKQQLVKMVMDDPESMNRLKQSLVADPAKAAAILDLIMANENLQEMVKEKTASLHETTSRR